MLPSMLTWQALHMSTPTQMRHPSEPSGDRATVPQPCPIKRETTGNTELSRLTSEGFVTDRLRVIEHVLKQPPTG
jgi:hypothetical protein